MGQRNGKIQVMQRNEHKRRRGQKSRGERKGEGWPWGSGWPREREEAQSWAVLENLTCWSSCAPRNCWVHALPGTEETTLMKTPLLGGRLDKCPGSAALLFLLSELGREVWQQRVLLVTSCPSHLRIQRQQGPRAPAAQAVNFFFICSLWLLTLSSALLKAD